MPRILHAPHRLFFFAAVVQILLASAWWAATLVLRARGLPAPLAEGLEPSRVHGLLMIYAFLPLFAFGFLDTAGPKWLGVPGPAPAEYVPAGIASAIAATLLFAALPLGRTALGAAAVMLATAWSWNLGRFLNRIVESRAPDRLHAILAAASLAQGVAGLLAAAVWLITGNELAARGMETLGLWGFLVPLFCTVCHRMLPFFTQNVVPFVTAWRPPWTLGILVGACYGHGLLVLAGLADRTWIADAPFAAMTLTLSWRWGFTKVHSNKLLAMLHIGFLWLGVAMALHAADALFAFTGAGRLGLAPVHALTIGFLSSLTMAMVSRVSSGHSGRTLAADRLTWAAFLLLQGAAFTRVAADLWPAAYGPMLLASAGLWVLCFGTWAWRYLPIYWRPRADGQPG